MGAPCSSGRRKQLYPLQCKLIKIFQELIKSKNMNQLVDLWPSSYLQMLKQKYKTRSSPTGLDLNSFKALFCRVKSTKLIIHIFQSFDLDQNGKLDFKEFCIMLSFIFNSDEDDRIKLLYYLHDFNKDGILDKSEFQTLISDSQFLLKPQQELAPKKIDDFKIWVEQNFDYIKFYEQFELLPGPLKEREIIRQIFLNKTQSNHVYVISYKWWELWRFYINYHFTQRNKLDKSQNIAEIDIGNISEEQEQPLSQMMLSIHEPTDPLYPKYEVKHGICESNQDDILLPIDEEQSLRPGWIDNSDIQGEFEQELRQNILINHDYLTIPQEAWENLVQWYDVKNSLIFKRKRYEGPKKKTQIIDLYPPLLRGYIAGNNGVIFKKCYKFLMSSRKTIKKCFIKLCQFYSVEQKDYTLFYKKVGPDGWVEVLDFEQTLLHLQILSGTFIVIIKKGKMPRAYPQHRSDLILGSLWDVQHPQTNEWLLCHISEFNEDFSQVKFHQQKESYQREFILQVSELTQRIYPPKTKSNKEQVQQYNLSYPGLANLGNTCFINTVLQCLINTPLLDEYLIKQTYKSDINKQIKPPLLIEELSKLAIKLRESKERYIQPYDMKRAIDQNIPQFSGYEQHDAQEFLNILLDSMSDEVKKSPTKSIQQNANQSMTQDLFESVIKEMFMGKTINTLTCLKCQNQSQKVEDYFTLSLPIPLNDDINVIVIVFRKFTRALSPQLKRYGIKVPKYGTLKDLYSAFESASHFQSQKYDFAEVYRNQIHRHFARFEQKTLIRQIGIKNNTILYAYEIHKNQREFEEEVMELMSLTQAKTEYAEKDYVDVYDQAGEWRHGQITLIQPKQDKNDKSERRYRINLLYPNGKSTQSLLYETHVAPFRSKVQYKHTNLTISFVINRIYNKMNDSLDKFAIPFMIIVPPQLTWKEFRVLIYNQAKRFIDFDYIKKKKQLQKQLDHNNRMANHHDLTQRGKQIASSLCTDAMPDRQHVSRKTEQDLEDYQTRQRGSSFQQSQSELSFLYEPDFPYRIRLLDSNTYMCIQCEKSVSYQNRSHVCLGCEKEMVDIPINFNPNTLISLDWLDSLAFSPFSTMPDNDDSYCQQIQDKLQRKDRIVPEQCLSLLTHEEKVDIHCDICKSIQPSMAKFSLDHTPNILVLHLKRFQFRDGYYEKIESDINFPIKSLNLKKWSYNQTKDKIYDLYAVANHFGNGQYGHYTAYTLKQQEGKDVWVHCDDDQIRPVHVDKVLSQYTYLLFYRRREFPTSSILNLTYKY